MPLPISRNTTYTAASAVKSADLNAIQDAIIGGKHGDKTGAMSAHRFSYRGTGTSSAQLIPTRLLTGGAETIQWNLPVHAGDRIKSVTFSLKGNGVADLTAISVYKTTKAGVEATIGSRADIINHGAAWADFTVDVDPDVTLADGESVTLTMFPNAANLEIGNIRWLYDRP